MNSHVEQKQNGGFAGRVWKKCRNPTCASLITVKRFPSAKKRQTDNEAILQKTLKRNNPLLFCVLPTASKKSYSFGLYYNLNSLKRMFELPMKTTIWEAKIKIKPYESNFTFLTSSFPTEFLNPTQNINPQRYFKGLWPFLNILKLLYYNSKYSKGFRVSENVKFQMIIY